MDGNNGTETTRKRVDFQCFCDFVTTIHTNPLRVCRKWIKAEVKNEVVKMEKAKYSCNFSRIS